MLSKSGWGWGQEGMASNYQTPSKKVRSEKHFLLNVKAKSRSCCKKLSLLGISLPLPKAEDQDTKKEWGHWHILSLTPRELSTMTSIYHYSAKGNWPNHFGLMFNRWENKAAHGSRSSSFVENRPKYPKPQIYLWPLRNEPGFYWCLNLFSQCVWGSRV